MLNFRFGFFKKDFFFTFAFNLKKESVLKKIVKYSNLIMLTILLTACATQTQTPDKELVTFNINIDPSTNTLTNFAGFGAEWDSRNYLTYDVNEDDFEIIRERLDWLEIPIVRIMMQTNWFYKHGEGYTPNSPEMTSLYRHLDYCQENNVDVILTEWGIEPGWLNVVGLKKNDDKRFAEIIGKYLDYLYNEQGYTCIKYFVLVNEPNYEVGDFGRWAEGVKNVYHEMKIKGLDKKIKFAGSGQSHADEWHINAVDHFHSLFGGYTFHRYEWNEFIRNQEFISYVKNLTDYVKEKDSDWRNKQVIISEAGMRDGQSTSINTNIDKFEYGMFMVDYAIQAMQGGAHGVLAWMLDDNSHPDFEWGMWKNKKNNLELRKWFYSWGLMIKYFKRDSEIFLPVTRSVNLRTAASRTKDNEWSFAFVNYEDFEVYINVKNDFMDDPDLEKFVYEDNRLLIDRNGFPESRKTIESENGEFKFTLPANSVVILTTDD